MICDYQENVRIGEIIPCTQVKDGEWFHFHNCGDNTFFQRKGDELYHLDDSRRIRPWAGKDFRWFPKCAAHNGNAKIVRSPI